MMRAMLFTPRMLVLVLAAFVPAIASSAASVRLEDLTSTELRDDSNTRFGESSR